MIESYFGSFTHICAQRWLARAPFSVTTLKTLGAVGLRVGYSVIVTAGATAPVGEGERVALREVGDGSDHLL